MVFKIECIYVTCIINSVKCWLKIISLPAELSLRSFYALSIGQCQLGKTNWASRVWNILNTYGFDWIWGLTSLYLSQRG